MLPAVVYSLSLSLLRSRCVGESAAPLLSDHALLDGLEEVPVRLLSLCICATAPLPGRLPAIEQAHSEPLVSDWNSAPPSSLEPPEKVPSPLDAVEGSPVARSPQDALARRLLCAGVPSRHTCPTSRQLIRQGLACYIDNDKTNLTSCKRRTCTFWLSDIDGMVPCQVLD